MTGGWRAGAAEDALHDTAKFAAPCRTFVVVLSNRDADAENKSFPSRPAREWKLIIRRVNKLLGAAHTTAARPCRWPRIVEKSKLLSNFLQ